MQTSETQKRRELRKPKFLKAQYIMDLPLLHQTPEILIQRRSLIEAEILMQDIGINSQS